MTERSIPEQPDYIPDDLWKGFPERTTDQPPPSFSVTEQQRRSRLENEMFSDGMTMAAVSAATIVVG